MLEFILSLGKIYMITGFLITFSFTLINHLAQDKENEFTFSESLSFMFFYPFILYYIFNKKDNG